MSMFGSFKLVEISESAASVVGATSTLKCDSNCVHNHESAIPAFCIKWLLNFAAECVPHLTFIL